MKILALGVLVVGLGVSGVQMRAQARTWPGGPTTSAANRPAGVNAPVPTMLLHAKTVFISNGGASAGLFPHPFTGTQDRGYGYFFLAISSWKRFQIVPTPAEADLVLQLELMAPQGSLGESKEKGTSDPEPMFKLTVFDRPTHYILWTVTQTVDEAVRQETHDKNFDAALDSVLSQLQMVAGTSTATP